MKKQLLKYNIKKALSGIDYSYETFNKYFYLYKCGNYNHYHIAFFRDYLNLIRNNFKDYYNEYVEVIETLKNKNTTNIILKILLYHNSALYLKPYDILKIINNYNLFKATYNYNYNTNNRKTNIRLSDMQLFKRIDDCGILLEFTKSNFETNCMHIYISNNNITITHIYKDNDLGYTTKDYNNILVDNKIQYIDILNA